MRKKLDNLGRFGFSLHIDRETKTKTKTKTTMNGTIQFDSAQDLAAFLAAFTGQTATFEVKQNSRGFLLTFNGGF